MPTSRSSKKSKSLKNDRTSGASLSGDDVADNLRESDNRGIGVDVSTESTNAFTVLPTGYASCMSTVAPSVSCEGGARPVSLSRNRTKTPAELADATYPGNTDPGVADSAVEGIFDCRALSTREILRDMTARVGLLSRTTSGPISSPGLSTALKPCAVNG